MVLTSAAFVDVRVGGQRFESVDVKREHRANFSNYSLDFSTWVDVQGQFAGLRDWSLSVDKFPGEPGTAGEAECLGAIFQQQISVRLHAKFPNFNKTCIEKAVSPCENDKQ